MPCFRYAGMFCSYDEGSTLKRVNKALLERDLRALERTSEAFHNPRRTSDEVWAARTPETDEIWVHPTTEDAISHQMIPMMTAQDPARHRGCHHHHRGLAVLRSRSSAGSLRRNIASVGAVSVSC